ncbi:MAG: hypothetical protein QHC79_28245 [Pseudosphingobacterium sp.]|nr:hypothetical protein [Pseudosphingobacterium sp.]
MSTLKSETPGTSFFLDGLSRNVEDLSYNIENNRLTLSDVQQKPIVLKTHYGSINNGDTGEKFKSLNELKSFMATAFGEASPEDITAALANKVDKVEGKQLSTNDYTAAEKTKLAGIAAGATVNATDAQLRDRATHTGTQAIATVSGLQEALDSKANA